MKYKNLETALIELINSGSETTEDGRFMTERKISEKFQISRNTVRRAIADLCNQGYLVQFHGKGTYVKNCLNTHHINSITRCDQYYKELGLHPNHIILHKEITPASKTIAGKLEVLPGSALLYQQILYRADRIIFNETFSYVPLSLFPGIDKYNHAEIPLSKIMESKYGAFRKDTKNTLDAILPPVEVAKNLDISANTPVMLFESVTSGIINNQYLPFEYFRCYYRTDLMKFNFVQQHDLNY